MYAITWACPAGSIWQSLCSGNLAQPCGHGHMGSACVCVAKHVQVDIHKYSSLLMCHQACVAASVLVRRSQGLVLVGLCSKALAELLLDDQVCIHQACPSVLA